MGQEFLKKLYLELHDMLASSVLTPREKAFIEIITKQNSALESIAADVMHRSPAEIANLAKSNTVVITERGGSPVPISQYVAKILPDLPGLDPGTKPQIAPRAPRDPSSTVSGGLCDD